MMQKEFVLQTMRQNGKAAALNLQNRSGAMTGTELYAEEEYIPEFKKAAEKMNMMERHASKEDGFVCKSSAGRVVRLIQNYDSNTFTGEPEDLPAQWAFVWSNDPAKARPFVSISTSPYMKGNCCTENGSTHRSLYDNNVAAPSAWPQGWEQVKA